MQPTTRNIYNRRNGQPDDGQAKPSAPAAAYSTDGLTDYSECIRSGSNGPVRSLVLRHARSRHGTGGRRLRRYQNRSNVFELMDEIRDKLRLLNYEELFCRHVAAPIHT